MASALAKLRFRTVAGSGSAKAITRAKKMADLAIRSSADEAGNPTVKGYEQAVKLMTPFLTSTDEDDSLDAQVAIQGYENAISSIKDKRRRRNETVTGFKQRELDAYFTDLDGDVGLRSPGTLVGGIAEELSSIELEVMDAIDKANELGESSSELQNYLGDLHKRSGEMLGLQNKLLSGELGAGKTLDGFGYYVDADPLDGSIRRAGIMPVGLAPEELRRGFRRLDATATVGGSLLPVYAPAVTDAMGKSTARVGRTEWNLAGEGVLKPKVGSQVKFKPGEFDITDANAYPLATTGLKNGQFAIGHAGTDDDGNVRDSLFYRGEDGRLYSVDKDALARFKSDPILNAKMNGYVPRFGPETARQFAQQAQPFDESALASESRFGQERVGAIRSFLPEASVPAGAPAEPTGGRGFFAAKNRLDKPDEAPASGVADFIEKGKGFFRRLIQ